MGPSSWELRFATSGRSSCFRPVPMARRGPQSDGTGTLSEVVGDPALPLRGPSRFAEKTTSSRRESGPLRPPGAAWGQRDAFLLRLLSASDDRDTSPARELVPRPRGACQHWPSGKRTRALFRWFWTRAPPTRLFGQRNAIEPERRLQWAPGAERGQILAAPPDVRITTSTAAMSIWTWITRERPGPPRSLAAPAASSATADRGRALPGATSRAMAPTTRSRRARSGCAI